MAVRACISTLLLGMASCDRPATVDREPLDVGESAFENGVPADSLLAGESYVLTDPTPILPDPDPGDPAMVMVETRTLSAPVEVTIVRRVETAGVLWYELRVLDPDTVAGWVSLQALRDQRIVPIP